MQQLVICDGKPDLVAGHVDMPVALLQNESNTADWLQLELIGTTSERDAVGAKVTVVAADQTFVAWITGGDGYHCTNESTVDLGLGRRERIDQLIVEWPSGKVQEFGSLPANVRYVIVEGNDQPFELASQE